MEYIFGGVYRIRVSIDSANGVTLSNSEWELVFSAGRKTTTVASGVVINDNEVDVFLDTSKLTTGALKAQLNMTIVDTDAPTGRRLVPIIVSNGDDYIVPSLG
jgi:hypothetical protein